jgi:hypothetical protein
MLAVMLRWLVGAFAFGIATSKFYHADGVLWPMIEAIDAAFSLRFPFHDLDQIERLSQGISVGCLGIVNGRDGRGDDGRAALTFNDKKHFTKRAKGVLLLVLALVLLLVLRCQLNILVRRSLLLLNHISTRCYVRILFCGQKNSEAGKQKLCNKTKY